MRRRVNSPLLIPAASIAVAGVLSLAEWLLFDPGGDLLALWVLWSLSLLGPAFLLCALAARWRALPETMLWLGLLWPAACVVFHQFAHEGSWPHLALGEGGLAHWSRVWGIGAVGLLLPAWLLARWSRHLASRWSPLGQGSLSFLAVVAIAALGAWRFAPAALSERAIARPEWPNILLLSIDTLRQDALRAYGGPPTALEAWTRKGVVLDGWAPSSWTLPSLQALMRGASLPGGAGEPRRALAPGDPWWPERLRDAGYRSAAVLSNVHLVEDFGFARGFDHFDHSDRIEALRPVEQAVLTRFATRQWTERRQSERGDRRADAAIARLDALPRDRPWLLWVHLLDPHLPYYLRGLRGEVEASDRPAWLAALGDAYENGKFFDLPGLREGRWPQDGEFLAALRALYAREVDFAAHHAARVLEAAQAASGERPWIWILTSDHGEEFFEHGGFEHGHALTPELLRVPLVVGGAPAASLPAHMRLQDIGPWLLARLSLPSLAAPDDVPFGALGQAVLGSAEPRAGCAPALLATHMLYGPDQARWIRPDGQSSLWDREGRLWRNDLCADPTDRARGEASADSSERALRDALAAWRAEDAQRSPVEIDPRLLERLRALGYTQ